jgi:DNA-binding NarL/FixJ family response regulator
MGPITVFVADDSVIIREGVSSMLRRQAGVEVVGTAEDYDGLIAGADELAPNVIVSDIRMPPDFQREGIEACKEIRKRHPGTGIVILSQYDDPDYAITLLSEGAAGYAYLLKDRIAEGDQLIRAIREVATGGSMLDPVIVAALVKPVRRDGGSRPKRTSCSSSSPRVDRSRQSRQGVEPRPLQYRIRWSVFSFPSLGVSPPARQVRSSGYAVSTRQLCPARSREKACRAFCLQAWRTWCSATVGT